MYMEKVKLSRPNELTGYRKPAEDEVNRIYTAQHPAIVRNLKIAKVTAYCMGFLCITFAISIVQNYIRYGIEMAVFKAILTAILSAILTFTVKSIHTGDKFDANLSSGNFKVLDVKSYPIKSNQDTTCKTGGIFVQTQDGNVLGSYIIDMPTVLDCMNNSRHDIPLLLVYDEETKESKVYSENILSGKCKL